jgi:membrane protein DedA with SNARE-associated domain
MPTGSITHTISELITDFIGNDGVYAVFVMMLIDAVFPAASELVMVYAGALAASAFAGQEVVLFGSEIDTAFWGFVVMASSGTLGYTLGCVLGWGVGAWGGRPLLERHGKYLHLGPEKLAKADAWFEKRGDRAVFLGRILPVVRSFVSLPAGAMRMPLLKYTWLSFLGSTLWCVVFAGAGWGVGRSYEEFNHAFRYVEIAVVVGIVAAAVWLVWRWRSKRSSRLDSRGQDPAG